MPKTLKTISRDRRGCLYSKWSIFTRSPWAILFKTEAERRQ